MKKYTFSIAVDNGREYVFQTIPEIDKNHDSDMGFDATTGEGRMYSQAENPNCPVASFKKYLEKLHLNCEWLWQRPLDAFVPEEQVWYCCSPLGINTLNGMMPRISRQAGLSNIYTNHSIRATSITIMDEAGMEARHIMRITGHKYVFLSNYDY
jgi:hypothetical protein